MFIDVCRWFFCDTIVFHSHQELPTGKGYMSCRYCFVCAFACVFLATSPAEEKQQALNDPHSIMRSQRGPHPMGLNGFSTPTLGDPMEKPTPVGQRRDHEPIAVAQIFESIEEGGLGTGHQPWQP